MTHARTSPREWTRRIFLRLLLQRALAVTLSWLSWVSCMWGATMSLAWLTGFFIPVAEVTVASGVVLFAVLMVAWWRRPITFMATGRRIDHGMGFREQWTTALQTRPADNVVVAALHQRTTQLAAQMSAAAVAPWRLPVRQVVLTSVAVALVALGSYTKRLPSPQLTVTLTQTPSIVAVASTDAERLARLATALEQEAARRFDPYLAGVAAAARDLSKSIERGELSASQQSAALANLFDQLAPAYGSELTGAELVERFMNASSDTPIGDTPSRMTPEGTAPMAEALQGDSLTELLERTAPPQGSAEMGVAGAESAPSPVPSTGGYMSREQMLQAQATRAGREGGPPPAGAEQTGAAENAQAGASRLAGRGTTALEGDAAALDESTALDELVMLSGVEDEGGRRIELEIPPELARGDYDPDAYAVGAWLRSDEAAFAQTDIGVAYRAVAGRYFVPDQAIRSHRAGN
jgi:hypothetical protein